MTGLKKVRLLGAMIIALVTGASRGDAHQRTAAMFCAHVCITGMGDQCPADGGANWCVQSGCGSALAGCVGDWGNCRGGYIIQCNSYQT
jgi:hypothetical protein